MQAFNDAYNLVGITEKKQKAHAPFVFVNNTGLEILLKLDPSFEVSKCCSRFFKRSTVIYILPFIIAITISITIISTFLLLFLSI